MVAYNFITGEAQPVILLHVHAITRRFMRTEHHEGVQKRYMPSFPVSTSSKPASTVAGDVTEVPFGAAEQRPVAIAARARFTIDRTEATHTQTASRFSFVVLKSKLRPDLISGHGYAYQSRLQILDRAIVF